jgi:histidyl-tRNA synthetase
VILGDELATGEVVLKNLEAGEQRTVPLADLVVALGRTDA